MSRRYHRSRKIFIFVLACLFPILFAPRAEAVETGSVAQVRSILTQVMAIQTNPKMAGPAHRERRKKAIEAVIARNFDMDRMAATSLGAYWKKLNDKQRAEFTSVFRDLFQDSYTRLVLDFLKREKIRYSPQEGTGVEALVKTVILRPNENIPVDYRLEKMKVGWLVNDVSIDGVSIVGKYRNAFDRVIRRTSYGALLERMRIQQKAIH